MPKRKKQNQQQQPPPPQQPQVPKREETGDARTMGVLSDHPAFWALPPMANGKPGDPKSALHRGPPGSRGLMIPPLLSLPPPPRGRGPVWGGLGPRSGPYGRGWWGVNAEPPFPGPGHGSPSRGGFTKNRDILEGSKVGRLSKTPAPQRMNPRLWKTNLTALSADTLPKRATVDMRTSVPSTTQASTGLLCETVPSHPSWKEPSVTSGHIFPCGPVTATVRLFHPQPSVSDAHPCLPPPSFGVQSCVSSLVHSVHSFC